MNIVKVLCLVMSCAKSSGNIREEQTKGLKKMLQIDPDRSDCSEAIISQACTRFIQDLYTLIE